MTATGGLRPAGVEDPVWQLWRALPEPWRGPVIGPGIEGWERITENIDYKLNLTGLPELLQAEMAWMAHWQATDGTRASVLALSQFANIVRRAMCEHHPFPASIRQLDWEAASALQTWYYTTRWGRFPAAGVRARLRVVFRFARTALIAACHDGPWWELDYWHPRCDPRIPLSGREPMAHYGCPLTLISHPWLREAVKWCLGTLLDAGTLRWTTISQERLRCLHRFDRWLQVAFDNPLDVLGDPAAAASQAAAFRRWNADPANRSDHAKQRRMAAKVGPRQLNDDLRAVGELFEFMAVNSGEATRVLGSLARPWAGVTVAHAASWIRQVSRIPHGRVALNDEHYVDDHALAQITTALPLLGLPRDQQAPITRGDGRQVLAEGIDDPQAMRMILLQILTGRRSSEIRLCDFDCVSAPTAGAVEVAEGAEIARFRYAQSKIDIAPDTILVDSEVVAIIEEQQRWVRERLPDAQPKHLFVQLLGNRSGIKPYPSGTYNWRLREFSGLAQITDSNRHPINLSHTHRFRHTKLTRLAELGLPIHVLQRYAGHATPSMSMHYIAHREEHAEQAFLATRKLKADGTSVVFSRDDHDRLHLFDRADRILPHGWCLLPPFQSCDKGSACLTCSVFVTDDTHTHTLAHQLEQTEALIQRTTAAFLARHGRPMPDDNVWLAQRHAERAALQRLLEALEAKPGRACQGAGCPTTHAAGPVPITLHRPGTPR